MDEWTEAELKQVRNNNLQFRVHEELLDRLRELDIRETDMHYGKHTFKSHLLWLQMHYTWDIS